LDRWRDVHHALATESLRSSLDRFITNAFREFLEEGEMAYPQQLTLKDLQHASQAVRAMHGPKLHEGFSVRRAFHALDSCAGLLRELGDDLREEVSSLAMCHRYGPAVVNESWRGHDWNWVLISYYSGNGMKHRSFGWGVGFHTEASRIHWGVWRSKGRVNPEEIRYPIADFVSKGKLDEQRLLDNLRERAKKWKMR